MSGYIVFNLLIISQFIDYNIGFIPFKAVVIFLSFIYLSYSSKILFKTPVLFLLFFLIYAITSSVNLYNQTDSLTLIRGYVRPLMIFITVAIQLYLVLYLFRIRTTKLMPNFITIFLLFEIILMMLGIVDNRYLKNEKGLHANLIVFLIFLFVRQNLHYRYFLIPFFSLASTVSSSILALAPLILMKKNIRYLVIIIFIPIIYIVYDEIVASKIGLLLSPPDNGTYGGRYWSNILYLEQIKSSLFFGSGIESLYLYKKEHYFVELFDHGGSDILRLFAEFGILGSILLYIFYLKIHNKIRTYGYKIDYIGLIIVLILSIKGIQIFSHPGMLLMVMFVVYKRNYKYIENEEPIQLIKVKESERV